MEIVWGRTSRRGAVDVTWMNGGFVAGEMRAVIREEYMAFVTRDSRAEWLGRERDFMAMAYVRGLWDVERVRRERRRSFSACLSFSWGRFGVAIF